MAFFFCSWLRRPDARSTSYGLRHRARHLLASGLVDEAAGLLSDPAYLEAKADAGLVFELATQLATRLDRTNRKLGDLAFVDVTGRVAHAIMDLCSEPDAMTHPEGMQIKVSRQELSRLVGCSREMAGRVLKVLEEANIKIGNVLSDVFGASGQDMLQALVQGKATAAQVAQLAKRRARKRLNE